jgi:hypothetical protein
MKTVLPCAVMLLVVLIGAPGYPVTLYDDFNAGYIDPANWFGVERGPATVVPVAVKVPKSMCHPTLPAGAGREAGTEAIRQVEDGRLRLLYQGYGRTDSNAGKLRRELNLIMQDSPVVTAIQATVEVTAVTTNGCPTATDPNTDYTVAWAWLGGRFFNATNSTNPSQVGDVLALIHLGRRSIALDPPDVLHAVARVFHCFDPTCTTFAEPLGRPVKDFGPFLLGDKVKLQVQWDQGNQQFIFQCDSTTEVVSYNPTLTFNGNPSIPNKVLSATLFVPNCMPPSRPVAFIDARFDDVNRSP